jgi:hypothetical protein
MDSSCYHQREARGPFTPAQPSGCVHLDLSFSMLKEYLIDAIDELVSVNDRSRINALLQKFDTEVTKAHLMMQYVQKHLETAHTYCANAIRVVLSRQDRVHVDDGTTIHNKRNDVPGQVVDDNKCSNGGAPAL